MQVTKIELSETEKILLEVVGEPRFTAYEKVQLVNSYVPVISDYALIQLLERIELISSLKVFFAAARESDLY